jgi:hypothetical protein
MMYAVAPDPACDGTDHGDPARPALHHRGQQELSQPKRCEEIDFHDTTVHIELRLQYQSALATALNHSVQTQAYLMAYSDAFFVIGAALLLSGTSLFFLPTAGPNPTP